MGDTFPLSKKKKLHILFLFNCSGQVLQCALPRTEWALISARHRQRELIPLRPPKPPEHSSPPPPPRATFPLLLHSWLLKKTWTRLAALALSMFPFVGGSPDKSSAMTWHRSSDAGSKWSPTSSSAAALRELLPWNMPCLQGCSFLSLLLLLQIVLTAAAGRAGCAADSLLSLLAAEQGQIFLSHFAVSTPRECISCVDACAFWGGGREEWHSRAEFGKSICAGGKKKNLMRNT